MKTFDTYWKETWACPESTDSTIPVFMESVVRGFAEKAWYAGFNEMVKEIRSSPSFEVKSDAPQK